jgi:hypothetical protein
MLDFGWLYPSAYKYSQFQIGAAGRRFPGGSPVQYKRVDLKKSGPKWEVIRWTYDPTDGRSKPESLGRVPESFSFPPKPLLDKCTPAERDEVMTWWKTLKDGKDLAEMQAQPALFPYSVDRVLRAIKRGAVDADGATRVWSEIDRLTAALRKAKLPRPPMAPSVSALAAITGTEGALDVE